MPRLPKPKALRQNHERRDYGLVSIDGGPVATPAAPDWFLGATVDAWDAFWRSPLATTVVPDTDLPAIVRLFGLRDERERMARAIRDGERVVEGSRGQTRANPLYAQISSFDAEIRQLEDRFGLTPQARLKLGVQLGEATRSLADINAALAADTAAEDTDLLLTLAVPDAADARAGGDRVDGVQPGSRSGRRAG